MINTKTKKIKKDFDSVAFFRDVKEQMAKYLQGKSFEDQKEILKKMQSGELKYYKSKNTCESEMVKDKKRDDR